MTTSPGLRATKKARTHDDLVEAAYALVREQGTTGLTAEAIANRAGVSRRTFFNYFGSVEAVLLAGLGDFFTSFSRELEQSPADEPVLDVVERLLLAPDDPELFGRIGLLAALGESSPTARSAIHAFLNDWLPWLTEHLQGRLPQGSEVYVANLATAIVAAAEASVHLWVRRTGATLTPTSLAELQRLFGESLGFLRTGFAVPPTVAHRPRHRQATDPNPRTSPRTTPRTSPRTSPRTRKD